jgi:hypothetical protein
LPPIHIAENLEGETGERLDAVIELCRIVLQNWRLGAGREAGGKRWQVKVRKEGSGRREAEEGRELRGGGGAEGQRTPRLKTL